MNSNIHIRSKQGDVMQFQQELADLSKYIQDIPDKSQIIELPNIDTNTIQLLQKFLEAHQYDRTSMKYTFPFKSNVLKDHIDYISFEVFKSYYTPFDLQKNAQQFAPIIQLAFLLDIQQLKKITNICLQIPLYCGTSENEIKAFRDRFDISEESLTSEIQKKIIEENKPIFNKLKENFKKKLLELEQKALAQQELLK
ncbi:hypothetical protein PPERSA_05926 [Pseudocohnilembus persalinus]|uniref:SKP1 component dimerisation domain-containing protein n=1 Tax=Pseudocohnilembus persalinus TaxID=266149 RepID=A0A0V0R436_PSEPJ|nr:hypothetical protein PPERSA_05926 [Pseudocohnilembus persalinus]|eukprot:KRX09257.1 hypothetical protein PPERSA_05926 [Pseudocohnilembus persalinus]